MNRPEKRNAMSSTMLSRLLEVFASLDADSETRVVVLRGAGKSFCAGLDLAELAAARASRGAVGLTEIEDVFHALERGPQPTGGMGQGEGIARRRGLAVHWELPRALADEKVGMS